MRGKNSKDPYQVLIVDGLVLMAKRLSLLFTSSGFSVAGTAANGAKGVELYKALYPNVDLVTLDITLPGIDGISALGQILEFDKQAKVVMISALGNEDVIKKCILMGAKSYIVKPLDRDKLLTKVIPILMQ